MMLFVIGLIFLVVAAILAVVYLMGAYLLGMGTVIIVVGIELP